MMRDEWDESGQSTSDIEVRWDGRSKTKGEARIFLITREGSKRVVLLTLYELQLRSRLHQQLLDGGQPYGNDSSLETYWHP